MRTMVLGAGAMGSLFGARLKNAGYNVLLVDTWKEHVNRIKEDGLKVLENTGEVKTTKIEITDDLSRETECFDLVIVFVKGYATQTAIQNALHLINEDTIVLTLQNGIGNAENLEKYVDPKQIAVGGTSYGGGVIEAGYVAHRAWGKTHIGPFGKECDFEKLEKIADILSESDIPTYALKDVRSVIWSKLLVNISYNGYTSITRLRNKHFTSTEEGKDLIRKAVTEALEVAKWQGIKIHFENPVEECIRIGLEDIAENKSSMLQDIVKERKTEIETINGAISDLGRKAGIPTPYNDMITSLVKIIENRYPNIVYEI
jgi:2-dehydropantoate 2-reductase